MKSEREITCGNCERTCRFPECTWNGLFEVGVCGSGKLEFHRKFISALARFTLAPKFSFLIASLGLGLRGDCESCRTLVVRNNWILKQYSAFLSASFMLILTGKDGSSCVNWYIIGSVKGVWGNSWTYLCKHRVTLIHIHKAENDWDRFMWAHVFLQKKSPLKFRQLKWRM